MFSHAKTFFLLSHFLWYMNQWEGMFCSDINYHYSCIHYSCVHYYYSVIIFILLSHIPIFTDSNCVILWQYIITVLVACIYKFCSLIIIFTLLSNVEYPFFEVNIFNVHVCDWYQCLLFTIYISTLGPTFMDLVPISIIMYYVPLLKDLPLL